MNEDALKERLKVIAKDKEVSFNQTWKLFLLERFLARLSRSKQHEQFIFKGGLLLSQYLTLGRETTDADFLVQKMQAGSHTIVAAIKDVTVIDTEDGFAFSVSGVTELKQPHMAYPGFRVNIDVNFGKMKDKIQIDIGVGDLVEAVEDVFEPFLYKGKPIFEGQISLLVYPVETIFAEKLETLISKGDFNSRMKDYHDLILMIRETRLFDIRKLKESISGTFSNRGTELKLPIQFANHRVTKMQTLWEQHLVRLKVFKEKLLLPEKMTEVLAEINNWLSANGYS